MDKFASAVDKVEEFISKNSTLDLEYTGDLDPFFKGDLDGKSIYVGKHLVASEKLFNIVHLFGHSVQWSVSDELRQLGSVLHINPPDELIRRLQEYEWEANCYGIQLLHDSGIYDLDEWLHQEYILDMIYLTHFYKTGEKTKKISTDDVLFEFNKQLIPKQIPQFQARRSETKRNNGIVIQF